MQKLARVGRRRVNDSGLAQILSDQYAKGDHGNASVVRDILDKSENGIIEDVRASQTLAGAVNRNGLTCWLDSLLFSMFASLDSYEPMLIRNYDDAPRKRLALMLRLWVNLLRTGKLINIGIVWFLNPKLKYACCLPYEQTRELQLALAACGWEQAAELRQQDASEAYTVIAEALAFPKLTLKMALYHNGKEDAESDQRLVYERVIEVAVPPGPKDEPITLEECLHTYLTSRVEVGRYSLQQRRNTLNSTAPLKSDDPKAPVQIDVKSVVESQPNTPITAHQDAIFPTSPSRLERATSCKPSNHNRSVDHEKPALPGLMLRANTERTGHGRRRGDSLLKSEVMMPAFQTFNLIRKKYHYI